MPGTILDKHIQKHSEEQEEEDEQYPEYSSAAKKPKMEAVEETLNHIKLEPEINLAEEAEDLGGAVTPPQVEETAHQDDNDFLDRLLDDLDAPISDQRHRRRRGPKRGKKAKPPTKDFKCSDCGKAFYFQKNLFTHVVERHGKSIDELPSLAFVKREDGSVRRRKKKYGRSGGSGRGDVFCDECGVYFKFASGLYNHRKRMHGNTEKKPCPQCHRLIKSCTLEQHVREEHGTPRFACQFCGKGFYYRSFMLNHQRLHTGDYKECICDLCGAVYKSVQVLNRHVRNAHQDLRNHKCPHCEKAFHNKQRLDRHINSQHTKSRMWPCPACSSKYDRKDNLRTHIRKAHSGSLNPDTVELQAVSVNDDVGFDPMLTGQTGQRGKVTIRGAAGVGSSQTTTLIISPDRLLVSPPQESMSPPPSAGERPGGCHQQERTVHVAQDLLSLKYGEEGGHQQLLRIPFTAADSAAAVLSMRHHSDQDYAGGGAAVSANRIAQRAEEEYFRAAVATAKQQQQQQQRNPADGGGGIIGQATLTGRLSLPHPAAVAPSSHHPHHRDMVAVVREVGGHHGVRDMMQAVRDSVAAGGHPSLVQTIHQIQNSYHAFPGLPGHPI